MHKSDGSPSAEQPTLLASILITIWFLDQNHFIFCSNLPTKRDEIERTKQTDRETDGQIYREMDRHSHTKRDVGSLRIYIEYNELWVRRVTIAVRNYRRTFIWPRCWHKQIRNYLSHTHIPYTHTMYLPVIWCSFYLWLVSLSLYLPGSSLLLSVVCLFSYYVSLEFCCCHLSDLWSSIEKSWQTTWRCNAK